MKVFITGASGYIGRHLVTALLNNNHRVCGLSRVGRDSDNRNFRWLTGSLETLKAEDVEQFDAVVHLAMNYKDNIENNVLEQHAVHLMCKSARFLVYTGNLFDTDTTGTPIKELSYPDSNSFRVSMENTLLTSRGSVAVVRPGFVYGGDGGYLWSMLPESESGTVQYVHNEQSHWPMIHVDDLINLYVHILEKKLTGIFHGFDGEKTRVVDIVNKVCAIYQCQCTALSVDSARSKLGIVADFMNTNTEVENARTLRSGWQPAKTNFLIHAAQAYRDFQQGGQSA